MNRLTYLEKIGKLTEVWYRAEYARIQARDERNRAEREFPCEIRPSSDSGHFTCWREGGLPESWCPNCQMTQPYRSTYRQAKRMAQQMHSNLARRMKRLIAKGWEY